MTPRERLVFMAIAERTNAEGYCEWTQADLANDTGLRPRTVNAAVNDLLLGYPDKDGVRQAWPESRKCIEAERRREGLRYRLLRPDIAVAEPREDVVRPVRQPVAPPSRASNVADPVPQNLHIPIAPEPQVPPVQTVAHADSAIPDTQNLRLPLMKSPLKDSPIERTSLRSGERGSLRVCEDAPAREGVADVRSELFTVGMAMLMGLTDLPSSRCRALLGRFRKEAREDTALVMAALERAVDVRPIEPIPFIFGALQAKPKMSAFDQIHDELGTTSMWLQIQNEAEAAFAERQAALVEVE
jgi:hypothetical protein